MPKIPKFEFFPTTEFQKKFDVNIQEFGRAEEHGESGRMWKILLDKNKKLIPLYVLEVEADPTYCSHMRWGSQLLNTKDFYFVIPKNFNQTPTPNEAEDDVVRFLVHGTGGGHLILINGLEAGSVGIQGREAMSLIDSICKAIGIKVVSVADDCRKNGFLLRILYPIAYGHSWFGKWDFKFHHCSFGTSLPEYEKAVTDVSAMPVQRMVQKDLKLKGILSHYQCLSDKKLSTVGEFFHCVLLLDRLTRNMDGNSDIHYMYQKLFEEPIVLHTRLIERGRFFYKQWDLDFDGSKEYEATDGEIVNCICGTTADDGEKMIQCRRCKIWQHEVCVTDMVYSLQKFKCIDCDSKAKDCKRFLIM